MDRISWQLGSTDELIQPPQNHGRRPIVNRKAPPPSFDAEGLKFLLVEVGKETGPDGLRCYYVAACNCGIGFIGCEAHWHGGSIRLPALEKICLRCELAADNLANSENERLSPGDADFQARLCEAFENAKQAPQTFVGERGRRSSALSKAVSDAVFRMIAEGCNNHKIATELGIASSSVATRRKKLLTV